MGLDILRGIGTCFYFLSQRRHKHPQGRHVVFPSAAPDLLGDIGVGQNLPRIFSQQTQQLVFNGRQVQLLAPKLGASGSIVNPQSAVFKDGLLRGNYALHGDKSTLGHAEASQ